MQNAKTDTTPLFSCVTEQIYASCKFVDQIKIWWRTQKFTSEKNKTKYQWRPAPMHKLKERASGRRDLFFMECDLCWVLAFSLKDPDWLKIACDVAVFYLFNLEHLTTFCTHTKTRKKCTFWQKQERKTQRNAALIKSIWTSIRSADLGLKHQGMMALGGEQCAEHLNTGSISRVCNTSWYLGLSVHWHLSSICVYLGADGTQSLPLDWSFRPRLRKVWDSVGGQGLEEVGASLLRRQEGHRGLTWCGTWQRQFWEKSLIQHFIVHIQSCDFGNNHILFPKWLWSLIPRSKCYAWEWSMFNKSWYQGAKLQFSGLAPLDWTAGSTPAVRGLEEDRVNYIWWLRTARFIGKQTVNPRR